MKKLLAALSAALMMMALFGAAGAQAAPPEDKGPGPNGSNEKGLCTAYFNGQKKGHNKDGKASPGPFAGLEEAGTAYDEANTEDDAEEDLLGEDALASDVFEFCNQFGIMGQPEQNGRYDCREGEDRTSDPRDGDTDGEVECLPNGTETD